MQKNNHMNKKSKRLEELTKVQCKNCGDEFNGRSNQLYCSAECKTDFNNRKDTIMRKRSRLLGKIMENNERILKGYIKDVAPSKLLWKEELKKRGFKLNGPFQYYKGKYDVELIVAEYVLADRYDRFELLRTLGYNMAGQLVYTP